MICFPLDDTEYEAKDMGVYLGTRTRGVFSAEGNFAVTPAENGLAVKVSPGLAWLKRDLYWGVAVLLESEITLPLEIADGELERIDVIVCRLDKVANKPEVVVKKGEFSGSPVFAQPQRDDNYDEIYLASVMIQAGATGITKADISSLLLNEDYCGLMRDGVTGIPTKAIQEQATALFNGLYEQLQGRADELEQVIEGIVQGSEVMLRTVYDPQSKGKPYIPAEEVQALIDDLKREIPQPGHWVFAPYRLTYDDEGVNAKRHPWVNFDDDLDKTVYAALYAAIGDTMSDGAADGMFNCKKLADRFPLVCGANFEPCEQGGEREHILTAAEMPKHTHATTIANDGSAWVAAWFNQNGTIHGKTYSGEALPYTASSGGDAPHNNMPPYLVQIVHIHT